MSRSSRRSNALARETIAEREKMRAVQEADDAVMERCAPDRMSPADAVDYLEQVIERCQAAIEALREENPELGEGSS